jgi:hypothetical protein
MSHVDAIPARRAAAAVPGWRCRKEPPAGGEDPAAHEAPGDHMDLDPARAVLCASCSAPLTDPEAAVGVAGSHTHEFFNPAGFRFEIGCFERAPGCVQVGSPTAEFTWFPGFRWCFSMCGHCGTHVGWRFSSDGGVRFWGLILKRLRQTG